MDFAKSAETILILLASHGKLSQRDIVECSRIPERTVRYNLRKLMQKGLVRERIVWNDLRFKEFERGDALCLNSPL